MEGMMEPPFTPVQPPAQPPAQPGQHNFSAVRARTDRGQRGLKIYSLKSSMENGVLRWLYHEYELGPLCTPIGP